MFRTRAVNRKINRLRERGLTASLNDETTTFNGMLSKGTLHVKNIQTLTMKFYNYLYGFIKIIYLQKESFSITFEVRE